MRRPRLPLVLVAATAAVGLAVVAHPDPASALSGTPTFTNFAGPSSLSNVDNAGEPSLGVNGKTGAMMYKA